jgi:hypothetical protein
LTAGGPFSIIGAMRALAHSALRALAHGALRALAAGALALAAAAGCRTASSDPVLYQWSDAEGNVRYTMQRDLVRATP